MQTTVNNLIALFNDPVFDNISLEIASLEAQSPVYDPNGDLQAVIDLVASLRTLSDRIADITSVANRVRGVKNKMEALPQTMRDAA